MNGLSTFRRPPCKVSGMRRRSIREGDPRVVQSTNQAGALTGLNESPGGRPIMRYLESECVVERELAGRVEPGDLADAGDLARSVAPSVHVDDHVHARGDPLTDSGRCGMGTGG